VNLRSTDRLQIILYTGVKKKPTAQTGVPIEDPSELIETWPAKDRCIVSLGKGAEVETRRAAFVTLLDAWLRFVRAPRAASRRTTDEKRPSSTTR
jgi:hypothetical protein